MMYYDRSIDAELAAALAPGGSLAWLMKHVRSDMGRRCHAHLEFRKTRGDRQLGSVQLYWGRTSPLEIQLQRNNCVRLKVYEDYRTDGEPLFSKPLLLSRLSQRGGEVHDYLHWAEAFLMGNSCRRTFLTGEAICHAGLMWRYGHEWRSGDPLIAVDSEARIGFDNLTEREDADAALLGHLGLSSSDALPNKLDALGVLRTGDIVLVEVKDAAGSITRAAVQLAAHMERFSKLMATGQLRDSVQTLLDQKRTVGVIPQGGPDLHKTARLVPWLAAPDDSADWPAGWREAIHQCSKNLPPSSLSDLTLVRLSEDGCILEEQPL